MKKIIGFIVVLCIMMCSVALAADEPGTNDITWTVENGILTIKGKGPMENYKNGNETPWYDLRSDITKIVVEDGITHIGNMAFYGLKNAQTAEIAKSVESVGLCAFSYTEGTRTTLGNPSADFQYTLSSDSAVVSKGDTFILTVSINGDFKDVSGVQASIVYDKSVVAIDEDTCLDEEWLNTIDDTNLGYISDPLCGTVANNFRIVYASLSGKYIDKDAPLYTAGKKELVVAKVICTALDDISNIDSGIVMIKNNDVALLKDGIVTSTTLGENQITAYTKLPLPGITLNTESEAVAVYAEKNGIKYVAPANDSEDEVEKEVTDSDTITIVNGEKTIESDVAPYESEDGCVMLPLRAIMENMGIAVIWDGETKTIFMATDADFAAHQLGKKIIFRNEESTELEHVSEAKDGRCFVSPDFFVKSFGIETSWNKDTKTATIK